MCEKNLVFKHGLDEGSDVNAKCNSQSLLAGLLS